jgi:tetratricopeptide (TPR) repeat protein
MILRRQWLPSLLPPLRHTPPPRHLKLISQTATATAALAVQGPHAVLRLPNGIFPLYLRYLRLEERYTEVAKAGSSIEVHMNTSKQKGSGGQVSLAWLSDERDKLRRMMSRKEQGDTLFRIGDYEQAAERYGQCLTIDNGSLLYNPNALEIEDSGGRLHAVLHCNRAACLMALKRYREAVKECTAALRIHTHYMKAMLR